MKFLPCHRPTVDSIGAAGFVLRLKHVIPGCYSIHRLLHPTTVADIKCFIRLQPNVPSDVCMISDYKNVAGLKI